MIHKMYGGDKAKQEEKVLEIMDTVGLARRLADSYPHELDEDAVRESELPAPWRWSRNLLYVMSRFLRWMFPSRHRF